MDLCKDCKHYKMTLDGPYCLKSAGHPKPVSPIMAKDCFEERPAGEPESAVPMEKPGYVPRTKICAKCGRELPMLQFSVNRRMKDGHQSECKECVAKTGRKSRQRLNERKRAERDKAVQEQLEAGVKVCKKCGRTLPLSAFGKGHAADGLQAFCKECKAEQGRAALAKRWAKEADAVREDAGREVVREDPAEPNPMVHEFECAIRSFEVLNPIPGGLVEIRLVAAQEDVQGAAMLALGGKILTIKIGLK